MIANQCHIELNSWLTHPQTLVENLRTARLPPLVVFEANAGKVGLLTRSEIVHLVAFSGTLHDLSVMVDDMAERGLQGKEASQAVQVLLSNACGNAAEFLAAVPGIAGADQDRAFISALRECHAKGWTGPGRRSCAPG